MAKRKAGVNDIIYELDNEDIETSSEDEVKEPKISRLEADVTPKTSSSDLLIEESCTDVINVDSSFNDVTVTTPNKNIDNGGKTPANLDNNHVKIDTKQTEFADNKVTAVKSTIEETQDTPLSNCKYSVARNSDKIPLITVHIRDSKLAGCKKEIKKFLLNLIKLHDSEADEFSNDSDVMLDIWPEDLHERSEDGTETDGNNFFFVDTTPATSNYHDVPTYRQASTLISNVTPEEPTPPPTGRRPFICFNCDGNHNLRDCVLPRNSARIAEKRKFMTKPGRYHVEDEQKYGHLVPGRISGPLRHALGLSRHELPLHIYRMRLLGYPPGWLEEARISHSGLSMFDSKGNAILDPEEDDGEICEMGSKDKFDIKKILDFPGFNVPPSPRYREEAHLYDLPPMSDQDSKLAMLQMLAPNAMKAYKRKKLTISITGATNVDIEGPAEMELDNEDEMADFPSVPPLPDEAPPPPPPPPPSSPPPLPVSTPPSLPLPPTSPPTPAKPPQVSPITPETVASTISTNTDDSEDDIEVIEVMQVQDIPLPESSLVIEEMTKSQSSSCRTSPSLDDLEAKKRLLLDALKGDGETEIATVVVDSDEETKAVDNTSGKEIPTCTTENKIDTDDSDVLEIHNVSNMSSLSNLSADDSCLIAKHSNDKENSGMNEDNNKNNIAEKYNADSDENIKGDVKNNRNSDEKATSVSDGEINSNSAEKTKGDEKNNPNTDEKNIGISDEKNHSNNNITKTLKKLTGRVKSTQYGTPVMNIASTYDKVPSDDKFAKDICDVINFENLPNSTGNYQKMCSLLKKVKSEVDRIQDS